MKLDLTVNGADVNIEAETRDTLLDVLRDKLDLTGTKMGCNHGQCGACTVLIDGRRVLSCLQLAATVRGAVTTIEGIGTAAAPHPMQTAFLAHDAYQCGYCTPGQILSAIAAVHEGNAVDRAAIMRAMSGNLCRCAAYPNICDAVAAGRDAMENAR
jgi:xanthine dehydrogenase YagT iron-sulfur-binding subunit